MIIRNQKQIRSNKTVRRQSIVAYGGIFILVISFLALGYQHNPSVEVKAEANAAVQPAVSVPKADSASEKISVDQLAAANAVTNIAEVASLPVAGELREATATLEIKKELSQTETDVITKPQIAQTEEADTHGITSYVTKEGDNLETIAAEYKVSSQTLRWANNMTSDAVEAGKTIIVPRVDGVVYTVKEGDTLDGLADKYKANKERIVLYNNLEEDQDLQKDMRIVLPGGELPENERPGYVAPQPVRRSYYGGYGSSSTTTGRSYGYGYATAGNRYAPGNCTWYAYERRQALGRPIGGMWGNAYSWAAAARAAGYVVDKNPTPGAVFQTSYGGGGYGHVGVVERVDGQNIYVSDMNYAGYNVVTNRTIPLSQAGIYNYIH